MPSWNIHTAHAERLLSEFEPRELGIEDANAFLFGNYVPDIYLGFLVQGTTFRLNYCLTHLARPDTIPLPDAEQFWADYILHPTRQPSSPSGRSLALGVWAHLLADKTYNGRFRTFCETRGLLHDEELRRKKQADFDLFGRALGASAHVTATTELLEAARAFRQYSILSDDVERTIIAADSLLDASSAPSGSGDYELLNPNWLADAFEACHEKLASRLATGGDA